MKSFILSLITLLLCVSAYGDSPVNVEQEKTKLFETDVAFAATSVEKGAAEAFKMFLAEDAMQLPAGGVPLFSRDAIYENMSKSTTKYTLAWIPQRAEVAQAGDMGWTWGMYEMRWIDKEGNDQNRTGKYLNVWRKMEDGSWRVIVDMGN